MSNEKKTYLLAPNWYIPPDRKVVLGAIFSQLDEPDNTLNAGKIVEVVDPETSYKNGWSEKREKDVKNSAGIFASLLQMLASPVNGDVSGTYDRSKYRLFQAKRIDLTWFYPSQQYLEESIRTPQVMDYLKFNRGLQIGKTVYMITGTIVARCGNIDTEKSSTISGDGKLGFDATSHGVPATFGPKLSSSKTISERGNFTDGSDFVLGYRLLKIKVRRSGKMIQKRVTDSAFFSSKDYDESDDEEESGEDVELVSEAVTADWATQRCSIHDKLEELEELVDYL